MKTALLLLVLLAVATAGAVLWIRLAPSDPARWHVDPATAPDPRWPHFARAEVTVPSPRAEVFVRLDAAARAEGAERLAGDEALTTWMVRTPLMHYPDYVTVRLDPVAGGTRLTAFSRSRFGMGDQGVNAARLDRWLDALDR